MRRNAVIVGGGISGLTAAYELQKANIPFLLFEQRAEPGGLIGTDRIDECVIERGPESFVAAKPSALELIRELGLGNQLIPSNDHRRVTYIVRDRKLQPMPEGMRLIVPTALEPLLQSPLLSDACKQQFRERWGRPAEPAKGDESLAEFTLRHFNQEWLDYIAEPLLAGVFGGDPHKLSATSVFPKLADWEKETGDLTSGLLADTPPGRPKGPLFWSLRDGMGSLIDALRQRVAGGLRERHVDAITGPPWRVLAGGEWYECTDVLLACQAYEAGRLLEGFSDIAEALRSIPYTSSATLSLGFERSTIGHPLNGFGFLAPACERRHIAACTWTNVKWDHRAPADKAIIRCFFGSANREDVMMHSEAEMIAQAREELRELMGIEADPQFASLSRWPDSMPQYTIGHKAKIEILQSRIADLPGLSLLGNYFDGVGIPDSVRRAKYAVRRLTDSAS